MESRTRLDENLDMDRAYILDPPPCIGIIRAPSFQQPNGLNLIADFNRRNMQYDRILNGGVCTQQCPPAKLSERSGIFRLSFQSGKTHLHHTFGNCRHRSKSGTSISASWSAVGHVKLQADALHHVEYALVPYAA